jgi:predicted glycoside hydrolase/deacetylase ChbG (UPF0249 family)
MNAEPVLTVTADDFGSSRGINRGVSVGHRLGIVTNASLMVLAPEAADAVRLGRRLPGLDVGLHVDLAEWRVVDGEWFERYRRCDLDDPRSVAQEVRSQLALFRRLVGRAPSHLDSHQHLHLDGAVGEVMSRIADELGIPLRARSSIRYEGGFYGRQGRNLPYPEGITSGRLARLVAELPPGPTELSCHPAAIADVDGDYVAERPLELAALCSPKVRCQIRASRVLLRRIGAVESGASVSRSGH